MGIELDGFATLGAMARSPEAFGPVAGEASKVALGLLTKALKERRTTVALARGMAALLPDGAFAHVTDAMNDAELASVASRLDPEDASLKAAGRTVQALRIEEIVSGARDPAPRAPKAVKQRAPAPRKPRSGVEEGLKVLNSKAMRAVREKKA